jgi:hydroxymethylpyrimidine pyrophosphatase-like HAD family hydrolase
LVWSVDDIADIGLLDVLPAGASKRHAIEALMREQGFDLQHTVFCGDSGNDMEVLISPIPTVLVANSRAEVKRLARELSTEAATEEYLYVAKGGLLGMNGNYSAGMLEGIAHYHPHITDWLSDTAASPETHAP